MQYCYQKMQLKCLFKLCCDFSEYQSENFLLNLFLLIILLIIGTSLCLYIFYLRERIFPENSNENKTIINNSLNPILNTSIFDKKLNNSQFNNLRDISKDNRPNLADRNSEFVHLSNMIIIYFNILLAFLFLSKFFEMLNLYNELNYNAIFIANELSTDKGLLVDDNDIPRKLLSFVIQIFVLILAYSIFNVDSEFLDHNKKNIISILLFAYYFYDSINIYFAKNVLLYQNYLFYAAIAIIIILKLSVYSIYINKIFFSKLSNEY